MIIVSAYPGWSTIKFESEQSVIIYLQYDLGPWLLWGSEY